MFQDYEEYSPTMAVLNDLRKGKSPDQIKVPRTSLSGCLNQLLAQQDISISILAELAGLNRTSLYRILSGETNPGRNVILRLALCLHATYDQTQDILKLASCAQLSGTRQRDIFIIDGILHQISIDDLSLTLEQNGFYGLYVRD